MYLQESVILCKSEYIFKGGLSLKIRNLNIHLYYIISPQKLKLCPCGIYRQLSSDLNPVA